MPAFSGSFSGGIRLQSVIALSDEPNHSLSLAEITGAQKCSDARWNDATITYWGTTDLVGNSGTQRGYFVNDHGTKGCDSGTFEGRVSVLGGQLTVEGTWTTLIGTGEFKGISGKGTFKTKVTSPTAVEATWQGAYEFAGAKAQAG